jgi:hypothetical protein
VEKELSEICASILQLLDEHLIPTASSGESKVFYLKMKVWPRFGTQSRAARYSGVAGTGLHASSRMACVCFSAHLLQAHAARSAAPAPAALLLTSPRRVLRRRANVPLPRATTTATWLSLRLALTARRRRSTPCWRTRPHRWAAGGGEWV